MEQAFQDRQTISARIDRLPLSRELAIIMLLAGFAWLIESYDIGIVGNILPLLEQQYQLKTLDISMLAVASTLGIVVALIPAGWLADTIGRKKVLMIGTAWYALFSLLCSFSPDVPTVIVMRFISGFGMGAVFPIPYAMATELMPGNRRGAMVGVLDSFLSFGYFLAPFIAFVIVPLLPADQGWRFLLFIGALPILYVPIIFKWMPESPRWLQAKGRYNEAERIVHSIETHIEQRTEKSLPPPTEAKIIPLKQRASSISIFHKVYLKRTVMMCIAFSCILFIFYAIQTYTPTVLIKQGYGLGNAFLLTAIIVVASIPGKYLAAFAVERFGRKPTLIVFTVIAALSALLFGLLPNAALALFFAIVMSFAGIGVDPVVKVYGAEQYPTPVRETGVSFFESVGRLFGGVLAPSIMAFLLSAVGVSGSYAFIAIIAILGVLAVVVLGTETKGKSIEAVVEQEDLQRSA